MIEKIRDNIAKGRYVEQNEEATSFLNHAHGWTDYFVAKQILFSHRVNKYARNEFPEELHAQDYYELLIPANNSKLQYICDGQTVDILPHMAVLTKPRKIHMFRLLTNSQIYDRYVLYFKELIDFVPDESISAFTWFGNDSCAILKVGTDLLGIVKQVENTLTNASDHYASATAALKLCELFLHLSQNYQDSLGEDSLASPIFINEIKEYIDLHFLTIRSVEELVAHFFYSREYITRSFRQYYHTPLYEYILRRKILHCTNLLREGESVTSAAEAAGFHNYSAFVRLFRRINGCTPSEYKKKQNY